LTDDNGVTEKVSKYPEFPSVENSQCAIEKGYNLDRVPVSFKPAFNGRKTIYARAWNGAGTTTGWIKEGAWTVTQNEPPVPISASPYSAVTNHQTFSLTFVDPNGAADIAKIDAVFAFDISDKQACHLSVDRGASRASLAGGNAVPLGDKGAISSAQCAISNIHIVEEHGRALTLSGDILFTPAFQGRRNIFLKASDKSGLESGWVWAASWDVH